MIIQINFMIHSFVLYYQKVNQPTKDEHFCIFDDILIKWILGKLTFYCHESWVMSLNMIVFDHIALASGAFKDNFTQKCESSQYLPPSTS